MDAVLYPFSQTLREQNSLTIKNKPLKCPAAGSSG